MFPLMLLLSFLLFIGYAYQVNASTTVHDILESRSHFSSLSNLVSGIDIKLENFFYQDGPYTVFLPSNNGVKELEDLDCIGQLSLPAYQMHLHSLVHYHITDQSFQEAIEESVKNFQDIRSGSVYLEMLTSETVQVSSVDGSEVYLHSPIITPVEVMTDDPILFDDKVLAYGVNGIILPKWFRWNLYTALESHDEGVVLFSKFRRLLVASGMDDVLRTATYTTLLAPTDSGLSDSLVETLLDTGKEEALKQLIMYHMLPQTLNIQNLAEGHEAVMTVHGEWMQVLVTKDEGIRFNQARLHGFLLARHGIVYRVSQVLVPPSWNVRL